MREEVQSLLHSLLNLRSRSVAALMSNTERSQPEPCCSNAGFYALAPAIRVRAIENQPGVRVGFIPEEVECGALQFIEQSCISQG